MNDSKIPVKIRRYCSADRNALIALWDCVFPDPGAHNQPADIIDDKFAEQPDLLFVAECPESNDLCGAIVAGYDGHRGWLNLVSVQPEWRGHGLGRQLVEHAVAELRAFGCRKINLQIREGNEDVIAFYRRLGFSVEARVSMGRLLS